MVEIKYWQFTMVINGLFGRINIYSIKLNISPAFFLDFVNLDSLEFKIYEIQNYFKDSNYI